MASNINENPNNVKQNGLIKKMAIAWIDFKFNGTTVLMCKKAKTILNDISGCIDFGTLNALMGPSGAGKSTLLKCINGRQMSNVDKNSSLYLSNERKIKSCFIVQDVSEHLLKGLTSIQSLIYASKLKNSGENVQINHRNFARKLLSDLMISDTEKTAVENCSGGEQKRIAIALELMAVKKPNLLCIDEPTSGLDSNAAEIVIRVLKDVSRKHDMSIVTSIHQPNNDVLMLFDKLYVLAKGGLCVYEGPPQDLRIYLNQADFDINEYQVPIEVLLKIASKRDSNMHRLANLASKAKSYLKHRCLVEGHLAEKGIARKALSFNSKDLWYLFQRTMTYSFRSQWKAMAAQFIFIVGLSYIVTQLYSTEIGEPDGCFMLAMDNTNSSTSCAEAKTVAALQEEYLLSQNLRFQFFAGLMLQFLVTVGTTLLFTTEVKIFMNEHNNGWYSTSSYYWAKTIVELPLMLAITLCYVLILYRITNQIDENSRFIGYLSVITAGAICSQGLGFTIGIIANSNDKLAIVLAVGIYLMYVMLCGFFAPIDELPEALQWITHGSYVKQTFEMQLFLIYGFDRCPKGMVSSILYQNNLRDENDFWINGVILAFHTINFRITALLVLILKANPISLLRKSGNKGEKVSMEPIQDITYM